MLRTAYLRANTVYLRTQSSYLLPYLRPIAAYLHCQRHTHGCGTAAQSMHRGAAEVARLRWRGCGGAAVPVAPPAGTCSCGGAALRQALGCGSSASSGRVLDRPSGHVHDQDDPHTLCLICAHTVDRALVRGRQVRHSGLALAWQLQPMVQSHGRRATQRCERRACRAAHRKQQAWMVACPCGGRSS